jgi:hypothetical protein
VETVTTLDTQPVQLVAGEGWRQLCDRWQMCAWLNDEPGTLWLRRGEGDPGTLMETYAVDQLTRETTPGWGPLARLRLEVRWHEPYGTFWVTCLDNDHTGRPA